MTDSPPTVYRLERADYVICRGFVLGRRLQTTPRPHDSARELRAGELCERRDVDGAAKACPEL
jgi:hypothetical protein